MECVFMGKKPSFVRTTISLSRDLKKRMDAVKNPPNWSAVAARAFEAELAEIAARKETKDMTDVIQRLLASKLDTENKNYKKGHIAGRRWAENTATAEQLTRLEEFEDKLGSDWYQWF